MRALVTVTALCAALALSAFAAGDISTFNGANFADAWPASIGSQQGVFGRAESGNFDGDGVPDVLLFDGDHPALLLDPDQFFAPVALPSCANDGSVLRSHTTASDTIAVVGSGGLQLVSFTGAAGLFDVTPIFGGSWLGARTVRCAQLDGAGLDDVCAVAADRRTLLIARQVAPKSFAAPTSFVAIGDVLDVLPVEWDGDANSELAILTNAGLQICELDGAVRAFWSSVLPGGAIARVHQQGCALDRVAWITAYAPPAQQWLLTLSPCGIDGQTDLGGLDVVAAIGADFDNDGDDDLLFSHRYSHELILLENKRSATNPTGLSFDAWYSAKRLFRVGPMNEQATQNLAWPALADFDGDGDLDIVFAVERTGEIHTIRGDGIDETLQRVRLASATYNVVGGQGALALQLNAPIAMPPNSTQLELVVRRRASASSDIEPAAISQTQIPVPTTWPATVMVAIPESNLAFTSVYDVQVRPIKLDSSGAYAAIHPATIESFTVRAATAAELASSCNAECSMSVQLLVPPPEDPGSCNSLTQNRRMTRLPVNQPPAPPASSQS
jgi:hypothetical protein